MAKFLVHQLFCLWLLFVVGRIPVARSLSTRTNNNRRNGSILLSRRRALWVPVSAAIATASTTLALPINNKFMSAAAADSSSSSSSSSNSLLPTLLSRLKQVPTFCIVNSQGAPFMVIKQSERMAKGYAFTSMEGAINVLNDAQKTAKEGGYSDTWKDATITTLPADIAVRLALQKRERRSQRGPSLDSLVDIIPTNENREDGLKINKAIFKEQGKTPLFYVDELKDSQGATPMYFVKNMLVKDWIKQHPDESLPPVQALELTYVFEAALRGYTNRLPNGGNISFVADPEQVQSAKKLRDNGLNMYKTDQMVI